MTYFIFNLNLLCIAMLIATIICGIMYITTKDCSSNDACYFYRLLYIFAIISVILFIFIEILKLKTF